MKRRKADEAPVVCRNRNRARLDRSLRSADRYSALEVIKDNGIRKRIDGKPVRDEPFRTGADGARVLQLKVLPCLGFIARPDLRNACFFKKCDQLGQAFSPPLLEVNILGMGDLKRWRICRKTQGHNETVRLQALGSLVRD